MNLVPLYMRILNEDMGDLNEESPVMLLKQCLPFLTIALNSTDRQRPGLEELITKIESLVGTGSKMSSQEIWKQEMHGTPAVDKIARTGESSHEGYGD